MPRLRSLLGSFLFVGDDVFKFCRVLSGGERQRVAIARLLLQPTNLLLLDEPTHHLDLAGKEVLEEALEQYPGAVIVVTHDRSLMARLATRILAVQDGRVTLYPGGYDDYEAARLKAESGSAPAPRAPATPGAAAIAKGAGGKTVAKAKSPSGSKSGDRAAQAETRRRAKESERLEKEIEAREAELKTVEAELADPGVYADGARTKELLARYERIKAEAESLWRRLEAV
jgi:ATP-binding cassette subfamily F protein 3